MNFDEAFKKLIGHEGGFQRSPEDRGNWTTGKVGSGELKDTKFGISAMSYPLLDIKNLTLADAKAIYKTDFWARLSLDNLPEEVRFDLFDTAVNSGLHTAAKLLQRASGSREDGVIGPRTIANCMCLDPQLLDKRFAAHRLLFVASLRTWPVFGRGWVRRVATNLLEN